jgi:hypothetical protein
MSQDYIVDLPEDGYQQLPSSRARRNEPRAADLFKTPEAAKASYTPPRMAQFDVIKLEAELRRAAYARCDAVTSERRSLKKAFDFFDIDNSGTVDFAEFTRALERFGLHMADSRQGVGGLRTDEARALFDKYDADGSGHLSYNEFADALLTHR